MVVKKYKIPYNYGKGKGNLVLQVHLFIFAIGKHLSQVPQAKTCTGFDVIS